MRVADYLADGLVLLIVTRPCGSLASMTHDNRHLDKQPDYEHRARNEGNQETPPMPYTEPRQHVGAQAEASV